MASLVSGIASSLSRIYRDILGQQDKPSGLTKYIPCLVQGPTRLGRAIFETFDKTVAFAESAKKSWDDALDEGRHKTAKRLTAISKVGRDLDKSRVQIEKFETELQSKLASGSPHGDLINEGLQSTSMYAQWCGGIKTDLAKAHQHSADPEADVFEDLREKCSSYAEEIRKQQNVFRPPKK